MKLPSATDYTEVFRRPLPAEPAADVQVRLQRLDGRQHQHPRDSRARRREHQPAAAAQAGEEQQRAVRDRRQRHVHPYRPHRGRHRCRPGAVARDGHGHVARRHDHRGPDRNGLGLQRDGGRLIHAELHAAREQREPDPRGHGAAADLGSRVLGPAHLGHLRQRRGGRLAGQRQLAGTEPGARHLHREAARRRRQRDDERRRSRRRLPTPERLRLARAEDVQGRHPAARLGVLERRGRWADLRARSGVLRDRHLHLHGQGPERPGGAADDQDHRHAARRTTMRRRRRSRRRSTSTCWPTTTAP